MCPYIIKKQTSFNISMAEFKAKNTPILISNGNIVATLLFKNMTCQSSAEYAFCLLSYLIIGFIGVWIIVE